MFENVSLLRNDFDFNLILKTNHVFKVILLHNEADKYSVKIVERYKEVA